MRPCGIGKKQRASMWNGRNEYWGFGKLDAGIERWSSFLVRLAKKSRPTRRDWKIGILRRRIWRLLFSLYRAGICRERGASPPSQSALQGRTLPRGSVARRKLTWRCSARSFPELLLAQGKFSLQPLLPIFGSEWQALYLKRGYRMRR